MERALQPEKNGEAKKRRNVYLSKQKGSTLINSKIQDRINSDIYPAHVFITFQKSQHWISNLLLLNLINYSELGLE